LFFKFLDSNKTSSIWNYVGPTDTNKRVFVLSYSSFLPCPLSTAMLLLYSTSIFIPYVAGGITFMHYFLFVYLGSGLCNSILDMIGLRVHSPILRLFYVVYWLFRQTLSFIYIRTGCQYPLKSLYILGQQLTFVTHNILFIKILFSEV
jgi:hypothetical protein